MEHFDPKLVFMQFQMSSMRSMDINPIQLFHTYPGRIISLHVQGVNLNPPPAYSLAGRGSRGSGRAGRRHARAVHAVAVASRPLARTTSNGVAFSKRAKIGGLQNFFVEQSWPLTQLSVAYLKALQV